MISFHHIARYTGLIPAVLDWRAHEDPSRSSTSLSRLFFSSDQFKSKLDREIVKRRMKSFQIKSFQRLPAQETMIRVASYLAPEDAREELLALNELFRECHIRDSIARGRDDFSGINKTTEERLVKALRSNREVVQVIFDCLDPEKITLEEVLEKVGRIKRAANTEKISFVNALYKYNPDFFECLITAKHPVAFQGLQELQESKDPEDRKFVALAYGRFRTEEAFAALKEMHNDPIGYVRAAVVKSYGEFSTKEALDALKIMESDSELEVQFCVVDAYVKMDTPESFDALGVMEEDIDLDLCFVLSVHITKAYSRFKTPEAFVAIREMKNDLDKSLQNSADQDS